MFDLTFVWEVLAVNTTEDAHDKSNRDFYPFYYNFKIVRGDSVLSMTAVQYLLHIS